MITDCIHISPFCPNIIVYQTITACHLISDLTPEFSLLGRSTGISFPIIFSCIKIFATSITLLGFLQATPCSTGSKQEKGKYIDEFTVLVMSDEYHAVYSTAATHLSLIAHHYSLLTNHSSLFLNHYPISTSILPFRTSVSCLTFYYCSFATKRTRLTDQRIIVCNITGSDCRS